MSKQYLIGLLPLLLALSATAQARSVTRIDSLFRVLASANDTSRIDCLNQISDEYIQAENKDSAMYYAKAALIAAKEQHYIHGIAVSFLRQAQIAKHFDDNFKKAEMLAEASLYWYERASNKTGLDDTYTSLINILFAQSKFSNAIFYAEKKYAFARQNANRQDIAETLLWMIAIYINNGNYKKCFQYVQQMHEIAEKENQKLWLAYTLSALAKLYQLMEDYPTSLSYYRQVLQMYHTNDTVRKDFVKLDADIWVKMQFSEVFSHLRQFDSAWHYYNLYKPTKDKAVYLRVYWVSTGECYLLQGKYQQALQNFQLGLAEHRRLNDVNEVMRTLLNIGKTYLAINNNAKALNYGREGLAVALQTKAKHYIRDGYLILFTVYDRLHQADSANFYFRQYIAMKESVLNDQTKARFASYDYLQKITLLNKERQIQQAQLEKAAIHRNILIGSMAILLLLGVFAFRNITLKRRNEKLESEKSKAELKHQAAELEMQALRAQMNPHFIFNCLNAINHFILKHEAETASDYLTKFSRLIRTVLYLSQKAEISLQEEIDCLTLYIQLEQLRFQQHFQYTILGVDTIDTECIYIPPMLLQPFVENAIWHGLMHKEGTGALTIEVALQDTLLCCTITDNGIGRSEAAAMKSKSAAHKKSMGMQITANRLQLLNEVTARHLALKIIDLKKRNGESAGTKVVLTIPVKVIQNPIPDAV